MSIKLKGSSDGSVTLQAPADTSPTGTDKTFTLPTADGTNGQVLQTNGSGALSFATVASSYSNSPLVGLYESGDTSISHATLTEYAGWTSEDDPDGVFASGRFTPTTAGRYLIVASGFWTTGNARLSASMMLYKNGTTKISEDKYIPGSTGTNYRINHSTNALISLNGSSDYVSMYLYQYDYTSQASRPIRHVTMDIIRVGD